MGIFTPMMLTRPPKLQAEVTISQPNPVSGTKYTVLDTTKNVRIIGISVETTGGTVSNLEAHLTLDDLAFIAAQATPSTGIIYKVYIDEQHPTAVFRLSSTAQSPTRAFLIEARSVKVEVEVTWTVQPTPLEANIIYAKY